MIDLFSEGPAGAVEPGPLSDPSGSLPGEYKNLESSTHIPDPVMWIRIGCNADQDLILNPHRPSYGSESTVDADPGGKKMPDSDS